MDEPPPLPPSEPGPITSGAGFGIRAAARILDTLYVYLLGFLGGILLGTALVILESAGMISPGWQQRIDVSSKILDYAIGILAAVVYHTITEGMYGASLGKLACMLRVVRANGEPVGMSQAFRRSLLYPFDALFFGLVGYSAMKKTALQQRNGDHWAHTVVVRSKDVPPSSRRGFEMFILALLIGSVCGMLALMIDVIIRVR